MKHCTSSANSIGSICEYIIKISQKDFPEKSVVQSRVAEYVHLFRDIFISVVEAIVLEDSNYMWSLSKPLLGLIIVNEHQFKDIIVLVIPKATTNTESQAKLFEGLSSLMTGVSRSMDVKNRDRFSKNFGALRQLLSSLNN
jgi:exportin-7